MPLRETEAIVLRTYRLGEADKIVSLFSRQLGKLRAVAAGAQRPKSRYGGVLEPLTYIRLWLFERENRDLLRMNSAELLESFFAMQSDYAVGIAAQYMAEVCERLLPEREVNERAFRLLLAVLRGLKARGSIDRALLYFNYWILRLGGFLPDLDRCVVCGRNTEGEPVYFEAAAPRAVCGNCRAQEEDFHKVAPKIVAMIQNARRIPFDRWACEPCEPGAPRDARKIFEAWVEVCCEKHLITRELMEDAW